MKNKELKTKLENIIDVVEQDDNLIKCVNAFMMNNKVAKYSISNRTLLAKQLIYFKIKENKQIEIDDFKSLYFLGFKEAIKQNKKIKKGSKAFYVYAPVVSKVLDNSNEEIEVLQNCFLIPVFCSLDFE